MLILQKLQGFEVERRKGIKMHKSQESAAPTFFMSFRHSTRTYFTPCCAGARLYANYNEK